MSAQRGNESDLKPNVSQIKALTSGMEAVKIKAPLNENVFGNLFI